MNKPYEAAIECLRVQDIEFGTKDNAPAIRLLEVARDVGPEAMDHLQYHRQTKTDVGVYEDGCKTCDTIQTLLSIAALATICNNEKRPSLVRHFQFLSSDCPSHDLDKMVRCPKCEAIRSILSALPDEVKP